MRCPFALLESEKRKSRIGERNKKPVREESWTAYFWELALVDDLATFSPS